MLPCIFSCPCLSLHHTQPALSTSSPRGGSSPLNHHFRDSLLSSGSNDRILALPAGLLGPGILSTRPSSLPSHRHIHLYRVCNFLWFSAACPASAPSSHTPTTCLKHPVSSHSPNVDSARCSIAEESRSWGMYFFFVNILPSSGHCQYFKMLAMT